MRISLLLVCLMCAGPASAARPFFNGALATQHPLGSAAGVEMLNAGGNAVDAIVAAAFVMAVVGPYHSGLGGGGFAVVHLTTDGGTDLALDFREVAPSAASRDMYANNPVQSTDGPLAAGVPGAIRGYLELHARFGKLPRAKVLAPAIRAAKVGFQVTPKYQQMAENRLDCLRAFPDAAAIFLQRGEDGQLSVPPVGAVIKQPDLAKTIEALARKGDSAFYGGPLGASLVASMKSSGGLITLDDLKKYHTTQRKPLESSYRGARFITMPPPSAGGLALVQTLAMLEANGPSGPASREVETMHVFIESLRRAFADRSKYVGDPAFVEVPVEKLTSAEYVKSMLASIDRKKATKSATLMPTAPATDGGRVPEKNTSHLSVVDRDGNAVALTTTVNTAFGSCFVAKGTGILLNNQMDDFATRPGVPNSYGLVQGEVNAIAPGKIPVSSMTPTIVFQKDKPNDVWMVVGSPGGSTIPTTVLQVISAGVDAKLDVERAVSLGRIHHQWMPDEVWVDRTGLEPATQKALEQLGHTFKRLEAWGDAEAVFVDPKSGLRSAASDPRNEGGPAGH